jgi:hypothetical protein
VYKVQYLLWVLCIQAAYKSGGRECVFGGLCPWGTGLVVSTLMEALTKTREGTEGQLEAPCQVIV